MPFLSTLEGRSFKNKPMGVFQEDDLYRLERDASKELSLEYHFSPGLSTSLMDFSKLLTWTMGKRPGERRWGRENEQWGNRAHSHYLAGKK